MTTRPFMAITLAIAALAAALSAPRAHAQQFVNGDFETGDLTGWTVTNTPNGTTIVQSVIQFDIDGGGPLATTNVASFQVGQVAFASGQQEGIELTQMLTLAAGVQYTISFNWAATRASTVNNAEGGVFTLFVDANNLATQAAGGTTNATPHYGFITANYTPAASGPARVGIRITRPFTIPGDVVEYVDNATITSPQTCPSISVPPANAIACPSGSAHFAITASGSPAPTYMWQIQTSPGVWQTMGNDPGPLPCGGGAFSYASPINSASVTIGVRPCPGNPGLPQHFQIRCVVTNSCGSATSNEATYTICPADFNCSGGVSVQDLFDFLAAWFAHLPSADFNGVNGVSVQDLFDFLAAWFAGCA